jgi:hypothetical protein
VSFLLDPLHVISKPGSAAWQAAGVKNSTPKREPKEPAIAVLGPGVRLEHSSEFQLDSSQARRRSAKPATNFWVLKEVSRRASVLLR